MISTVFHRVRRGALLTGVAAVLCLPAAVTQADDAGLDALHAFIDTVQTMSARFEQSLVDADDNVVETSAGTLEIKRPGRFRWSYTEPYEQLLVADGLNVWNYDIDLAQVTVKPQAEVLASTPALLLGGAGDVLADFDYDESYADRGTQWVRLIPHDTDSGFTALELGFTDGTLSRMVFRDSLDQSTLIALHDVTVNADIADSQFTFEPPADADLVGKPLLPDASN